MVWFQNGNTINNNNIGCNNVGDIAVSDIDDITNAENIITTNDDLNTGANKAVTQTEAEAVKNVIQFESAGVENNDTVMNKKCGYVDTIPVNNPPKKKKGKGEDKVNTNKVKVKFLCVHLSLWWDLCVVDANVTITSHKY